MGERAAGTRRRVRAPYGEDRWLADAVAPGGRFLDLGANDGVVRSNTIVLARRGDPGVYVEASPWTVPRLVENVARFDATVVAAAVVPGRAGWAVLWASSDRDGLLSTVVPRHRLEWPEGEPYRPLTVPTVGLDRLLRRYGPFAAVSIDVEGLSAAIALRLPLTSELRAVVVEADGREAEIARRYRAAGFEVEGTPENMLLSRKPACEHGVDHA